MVLHLACTHIQVVYLGFVKKSLDTTKDVFAQENEKCDCSRAKKGQQWFSKTNEPLTHRQKTNSAIKNINKCLLKILYVTMSEVNSLLVNLV